jgi:hypothetical protein
MNKIKLAAGVLLVFLVGALAGSLGTGIYFKKRVEKFEAGGPPVQERIQIILGRFANDLNLTGEQRDEFEKIIKESQEKKLALGQKVMPEIKEINDKTFKSIRDKLTDEQKTKLDALLQRMNEVRNRFPSGQNRQDRKPDQAGPQQQSAPGQSSPQATPEQSIPGAAPEPGFGQGSPESMLPKGANDVGRFQRGYGRLGRVLNKALVLSQEQDSKVRSLIDKFSKDQQNVFEKYKDEKKDSAVLKKALQETENSFEKDLTNILTKEQIEKYKKAKESGDIRVSQPDTP